MILGYLALALFLLLWIWASCRAWAHRRRQWRLFQARFGGAFGGDQEKPRG